MRRQEQNVVVISDSKSGLVQLVRSCDVLLVTEATSYVTDSFNKVQMLGLGCLDPLQAISLL